MSVSIRGMIPLIHVFDMSKSVSFYCEILGFTIVSTSNPGSDPADADFYWAMLTLGSATLMLNTAYEEDEQPPTPAPSRVAGHADTALYFACENVDDIYAYLCAKDWPAEAPVATHYGMTQVYTQDPDGFTICFQHPTLRTSAVAGK